MRLDYNEANILFATVHHMEHMAQRSKSKLIINKSKLDEEIFAVYHNTDTHYTLVRAAAQSLMNKIDNTSLSDDDIQQILKDKKAFTNEKGTINLRFPYYELPSGENNTNSNILL